MLRRTIGSRIQVLRMQSELTQVELAAKARVHRSYLASVETGERNISLDSLEKIIKALDVDYKSFFYHMD